MAADIQSLLDLPISTLTVLAGGYLGYRLAYVGKDKAHKTADTVFLTLVFGLIAKVIFGWIESFDWPSWISVGGAILSALVASSIWRKWGQKAAFKLLRKSRISSHDGQQTAWDSVISDDGMKPSQLIVRRKDGVTVMCDDLHSFEKGLLH